MVHVSQMRSVDSRAQIPFQSMAWGDLEMEVSTCTQIMHMHMIQKTKENVLNLLFMMHMIQQIKERVLNLPFVISTLCVKPVPKSPRLQFNAAYNVKFCYLMVISILINV